MYSIVTYEVTGFGVAFASLQTNNNKYFGALCLHH